MNKTFFRYWILAFPLLGLFPGLWGVFFPAQSSYSDLLITHLPNALWIQNSLSKMGEIPLWSRLILSGYPFSANPLAGIFYFPSWWGLLFPQPAGLYGVIAFHLFVSGIGMAKFLEEKHMPAGVAIFGGLAFETMPRLWAHFLAGHMTLVFAMCWVPWLFWATERWIKKKGVRIGLPAMFWGLITLADLRVVLPIGVVWGGYLLFRMVILEKRWKDALLLGFEGMAGLILSTAVWLPLSEYARLSTRSGMSGAENLVFSLPLEHLWGLFIPDLGGSPEWVIYPGAMLLVLLPFSMRKHPESLFWWFVSLLAIFLSLGEASPGGGWLYRLLGLGLLRVPARMLFVTQFAWIMLGALVLFWWMERPPQVTRLVRLMGIGMVAFLLLLALGVTIITGNVFRPLWVGGLVFFLAYAWMMFRQTSGKLAGFSSTPAALWGMVVLCNGFVIASGAKVLPVKEILNQNAEVVRWMLTQEQKTQNFRTYSPSYSLPQQTAAVYGIEMADGVDPLILASYQQFMEKATGVPSRGYSVTLPPFETGEPSLDNRMYEPNLHLLALVGVKYLLAEFDLKGAEEYLQTRIGETRIYKNPYYRGMAWLEREDTIIPIPEIRYTANTIEIPHVEQGRLVLAEINYPGWKVLIDGEPGEIITAYGVLRSVLIPPGFHQIRLEFHPRVVYWGVIVSVISWGVLGILLLRQKRIA